MSSRSAPAPASDGISGAECNSSLFEDLYIEGNDPVGIWVGLDSVLSRVRSNGNLQVGILADGFCTIVDCIGSENGNAGINAGTLSNVSRCTTRDNGGYGIVASDDGNIFDCVSAFNNTGISADGGIIRDNLCYSNSSQNIAVFGAGGTIVRNNMCSNSPGYGIYAGGGSNHIEANLLKSNYIGLVVDENDGNFIVRNTAINSTAGYGYYSLGGNDLGQILKNPGHLFVSSNSWANIERQ